MKTKFVQAMERDVKVGDWKPTRLKIVAEKYIREFWEFISMWVYVIVYLKGTRADRNSQGNGKVEERLTKPHNCWKP